MIRNPFYEIDDPVNNMFSIRKNEYDEILSKVNIILQPARDLDFIVEELDFYDHKFTSGELHRTLRRNLIIKLKKRNSTIDLSMSVPKLIDNNYFYINGRKKMPLFQMFDLPVVTRGKIIKLRTCVSTLMLINEKTEPFIKASFLGKKVPLVLLMACYFSEKELEERKQKLLGMKEHNVFSENLLKDIEEFQVENEGIEEEFLMEMLGRHYTKYNIKSKGYDVIYALDIIPKVDIMSSQFFRTENVLDEILYPLINGFYNDLDLRNKRIRCFEYVVLEKVAKAVFDLCVTNRTTRNPNFNINTSHIISECNVSDIVQFDFAINPIEELTSLSRTSLVGPGGFKRENVPRGLRDINDSMYNRICPVDTPDRENCGVLQNLLINTKLDNNLRFSEERSNQPISIPVSFVPFLERDDQTRLQMASSQMRQTILLKNNDSQLIKTGCEGLYTDKTQFVKTAKNKGTVIYLDQKILIVKYEDETPDFFEVGHREIYVKNLDIYKVYVKVGDTFNKGDILAESLFCRNGEINFGKNLLTGVMVYYGYNYEDGIVISDRLIKDDSFTSVHFKDLSFNIPSNKVLLSLEKNSYKPLPEKFERIYKGQAYAKTKSILSGTEFTSVFEEVEEQTTDKNVIITDLNLYINDWNKEIPEYSRWVETVKNEQIRNEDIFRESLKDHFEKRDIEDIIRDNFLNKFSQAGRYKIKGERISGILVEMSGIFFRKIQVGDKIANRHGNKGVISAIIPEEKMPVLEDGRHLDICINPLGIISRMNIGQLFELHLGMAVNTLKMKSLEMLKNSEPQEKIKEFLIEFIKIIDRTEGNWYTKQFIENFPENIEKEFLENFSVHQPPFESTDMKGIEDALKYTNENFKYKVFDPISKMDILNEVAVGFLTFFRIAHIAEDKLAARGIGSYTKKTLQPLGGRKNKGGQRCGEMESASLIGYEASTNLFEMFTTKSDCIDLKNQHIKNSIRNTGMTMFDEEINISPESVNLLYSYLKAIGIEP